MKEEMSKADVIEIAHVLKARKNNYQGMVLFLGSRAGGLFHNQSFYEIMRGYSTHNFNLLTHEEQFSECYKILQKGRFSENEIHIILTLSLKDMLTTEANICLAELIKQDFFDIIISTNVDSVLEDALKDIGMKEPHDFEVLIPGRDSFQDVVYSDRHFACKIIKTFGDLPSRVYNMVSREVHIDNTQGLKDHLQNILARDVLVIGFDPVWDADILQTFTMQKSSLWFVTEREFSTNHPFISHIEQERQFKFIEKIGSCEQFLKALYWHLHGRMPGNYHLAHEESRLPYRPSHDEFIKFIEAIKSTPTNAPLVPASHNELEAFLKTLESILQRNTPIPNIDQSLLDQSKSKNTEHPVPSKQTHIADVLLVTVTEIEARAVLDCCSGHKLYFIGERTYYDLGVVGEARVFMVQSEMGSDGLGGSRFTVEEGIRALSPAAVIMVGIAFGMDTEKQHIGDILVSRQLVAYDPQRIGSGPDGKLITSLRGDRVSVPIRLLDRFKAGLKTWQEPPYVRFGLILSGTKLIDNQNFRDLLRQLEGEAIGGEMEGVGLYEAAQRYNVDWLLVKAICDWADGRKGEDKDNRQKEAACNAARFTFHVIQQGVFRNLHASS